MLSYYPIIVDGLDMTSGSSLSEWLIGCTSFADAPFDYLVVLCTNEFGKIVPTALQIPKRLLADVRKAIDLEDNSLFEKLTLPYPIDVTAQMLDCFHKIYDLSAKIDTDMDLLPIGDIAEELWIYSTTVDLLTEPEDAEYLGTELQNIKSNIAGMTQVLVDKISLKNFNRLTDMCNNVFKGKKFDDVLFNELIESFI